MILILDMAAETAKARGILKHQADAWNYLDGLLEPQERAELATIWRTKPPSKPKPAGGQVHLFMEPTINWDGRLRRWQIFLVAADGRRVDSVFCHSGAPSAQDLVDPRRDFPQSNRPIPAGRYRIGRIELAPNGTWGDGIGRVWVGLEPVTPLISKRSAFGFHLDANRETSPGSAGCPVFDQPGLERLLGWLGHKSRPAYLDVSHQMGTAGKNVGVANPYALVIVREFEGLHLEAYPDPLSGGEPWTIGWGTTLYPNGRKVRRGDRITRSQADSYLDHAIIGLENSLSRRVPHWDKMNDRQQAALISFSYNLGAGFYGAKGFQTITRVLQERDWGSVPQVLELYRNPGTNVEAGLLRRRKAEGALWKG